VNIGFDIAYFTVESFFPVRAFFELLALLQERLGLFLIVPEIGVAGFNFQLDELFTRGGGVKDSFALPRCVSGGRRSGVGGLRCVRALVSL
jgi:hypothetical protein